MVVFDFVFVVLIIGWTRHAVLFKIVFLIRSKLEGVAHFFPLIMLMIPHAEVRALPYNRICRHRLQLHWDGLKLPLKLLSIVDVFLLKKDIGGTVVLLLLLLVKWDFLVDKEITAEQLDPISCSSDFGLTIGICICRCWRFLVKFDSVKEGLHLSSTPFIEVGLLTQHPLVRN